MNLNLLLLIVYSAGLILLGLWIGRLVKTSGSFFVAGRGLSPTLLFATMLAANIGAGSTVGASGRGYAAGLAAWWWVGSAGIGSIALGLWVGPKIWEAARKHDLQTAGDYLELRYGRSVRGLAAALIWLATLTILAGQFIAVSKILLPVAGIPLAWGCLLGGATMIVYFTAGGLLSSAWVNLVQLGVLLGGFLVAVPIAVESAGGWQAMSQALPEASLNFWQSGTSGWQYLPMLAPAFIISPGLLQKIYGARDKATVRWAVTGQGLVLLAFAALPALLGMCAKALFPEIGAGDPETMLARLLLDILPPAAGSLLLAAVFSAEISSADAILFMLSTSLSKDLYKRFLRPQASDRDVLRVARGAAVGGGLLAILLALSLDSVIESLTIFYTLLVLILFVPITAGLYQRRGGTAAALGAIAAGLAAWALAPGTLWSFLTPQLQGIIASALVFAAVAAIERGGR